VKILIVRNERDLVKVKQFVKNTEKAKKAGRAARRYKNKN
jgi:hypothetical protein